MHFYFYLNFKLNYKQQPPSPKPKMAFILQQVIIYQTNQLQQHYYLKIQSQQTYFSSVSILPIQNTLKYYPKIIISQQHPLQIEIWNYDTIKVVKSWIFSKQEVPKIKSKHIITQNDWTIFLKKNTLQPEFNKQNHNKQNVNRINKLRSENYLKIRPKLKTYNDKMNDNKRKRQEINEILENKSKRDKKSVKKVLKTTIEYLMKQQNQIHNDNRDYDNQKFKSAKCTPNIHNMFSPQNSNTTIFVDYGLNCIEEGNVLKNDKKKVMIGSKADKDKKKNNKIR